jgi:regulator of sigma D
MRNEPYIGWVSKRSPLLTALWQMNGLPPYDKSAVAVQAVLRRFCQDLMDYASEGHFKIFEQFLSPPEMKNKQAELDVILKRITKTTTTMVEFNDAFDNHENLSKHRSFPTFLSVIGETLAKRFELEDELIRSWEQAMAQKTKAHRA